MFTFFFFLKTCVCVSVLAFLSHVCVSFWFLLLYNTTKSEPPSAARQVSLSLSVCQRLLETLCAPRSWRSIGWREERTICHSLAPIRSPFLSHYELEMTSFALCVFLFLLLKKSFSLWSAIVFFRGVFICRSIVLEKQSNKKENPIWKIVWRNDISP